MPLRWSNEFKEPQIKKGYILVIKKSLNWNYVFFPGVIFHELSHFLACILVGARIIGGKFWGKKEAEIMHEELGGLRGYFISSAPFLFGSFAAIVFIYLGQLGVTLMRGSIRELAQVILFYYLGMSIAFHCFPSKRDAMNARRELSSSYQQNLAFRQGLVHALFAWITLPIFVVLYFLAVLMQFFSEIRYVGLLWFVILFFSVALLVFG